MLFYPSPFPQFFTGLGISQPAVVPSPSLFPTAHAPRFRRALPAQVHMQLGQRGKNSFSPAALLVLLSVKCTPRCSATHPPLLSVFLLVPPQCQLFLSVHPGSLMLEDLPYERFRRAENCSLLPCASLSPSINSCLTDLLSLQTTPRLTSPKGTPGVPQSDSHYAEPEVRFPFTHTGRAEQSTAQHSTARRQMLHLLFHSEYTHKELRAGTQRVQATPPPPGIGWWLL